MKGDFSRRTFDASKHFSAVLVEQGRLLTDADSEEEHRIVTHRHERGLTDVIGPSGGPLPEAGFELTTPDGTELRIDAGSYYVNGTLLENEAEVGYPEQPDRFDVVWPLPAGRYAIALEAWRRLVTALDDPSIREVALGGPTTSSRERVVWQVGAFPVSSGWVCGDGLPTAETTTGELAARAEPDAVLSSPCLIPPQAGYTGLENQLYRVEVFGSGEAYDLDAAADTVAVIGFPVGEPNKVVVAALGTLAVGDAVEVYRSGAGSDPSEATFGYVVDVDAATLTLSVSLPTFGPTDGPTLRRVGGVYVVSRDNGSVVTGIDAIDGVEVSVHNLGPDDVLGFAVGQLVEISDDRIELGGLPRRLQQIADIDTVRRVVVLRTPAEPLEAVPGGVEPNRHPKLRRWDAAGGVRFRPDGTGWIHLENGIQVQFVDGHYRTGDFWMFPARSTTVDAASGTIEWPQPGGAPALLAPYGIERHRSELGYLDIDAAGTITTLVDCRHLFPPLTSMRNLLHVGGDGQEGSAGAAVGGFIPLPGRLAVRVANGGLPVEGAFVRFTTELGAGRLDGVGAGVAVDVVTDADGLATVGWDIDTSTEHQLCVARLLDPSDAPIAHQVVRFHATIDRDRAGRRGCCFTVGPGGDYPNIEEALTDLFSRDQRDICLCLMPGDHRFDGGTMDVASERLRLHLSIHGCGRGTRLVIEERWQLIGWASFLLRDIDLYPGPEVSIELVDVADVELSGCHVFGLRSDGAIVSVQSFDRLEARSNVLVARRPGGFEGLQVLLDGLDPLGRPWESGKELELERSIMEVAEELADLAFDARRDLTAELRRRVAGRLGDELSRGELDAAGRLADVLDAEPRWPALAQALERLARATTVALGGVALEMGPTPTGQIGAAAPRVSIVLADNDVVGTLIFYGRSDPEEAVVDDDTLELLDSGVTDNLQIHGQGGEVHVRDNRIGRIGLGLEMIQNLQALSQNPQPLLWAYECFHLTDNVIDDAVSQVLARHLAVTGNDFTLDSLPPKNEPTEGHVAHVIGDTAIYTGNHARFLPNAAGPPAILDVTRSSAEGVNLEVVIE